MSRLIYLDELGTIRKETWEQPMGYPVNTQTERNSLHLNQVDDFSRWLEEYEWKHLPTCEYELIRMHHRVYEGLIIVWKREKATEHATIQGPSTRWYYRWKKYNEQAEKARRAASG